MRRRGFTVAELLVVVAIIGILAAMLFPVFLQAREEARAKGCFANVWRITQAIRMYAADNDWRLFPGEHDPRALNYFSYPYDNECSRAYTGNPYLRVPVILSGYLPRRVWQCPKAKLESHASWIVPPGPNGDWLQAYIDNEGNWGFGAGGGPCYEAWPTGWGGVITDSFLQGMPDRYEADPSAFAESIGPNERLTDLTLGKIDHPGRYIVTGDDGKDFGFSQAEGLAFPDTCGVSACGLDQGCPEACVHADWVNCPDTVSCGLSTEARAEFFSSKRVRYGYTRHYGGSNLGFFDGHAAWYSYRDLVKKSPPFPGATLEGVCSCWIGSWEYANNPAEE